MSVVVRRVGPEAAADVLAVVHEAFGARPATMLETAYPRTVARMMMTPPMVGVPRWV